MTASEALAEFREERLEGESGTLRYLAAGSGSGPALLLVHGLGGSALNWVRVAPALARRHRVLVPDLPGHRRSDPLPRVSVALLADRLADLVRREGAPVVAVGHSLGGLVSLRLAARHPSMVAGLLLAAAAGISSSRPSARFVLNVLGLVRPGRRLSPHRRRVARSPRLRRLVFGWWGASDPVALPSAAVDGFLAGWDLHTDTRTAARAVVVEDARMDLGQIHCPCLVLWGARDHQLRVGDAFDFARRLRAPVRVIPDCGHLLIGERPDAVLDAIESLLDGIRQLDELPLQAETLG